MRANSLFWRMTQSETEAAIAILNAAVERYPHYAPAHSMLAFILAVSGHLNLSYITGSHLARAMELGARAAELDDSDPWAHLALGYAAFMRRSTAESTAEFQRALELNPNFAAAHGYLGWALAFDGQSDKAIVHLEEAIRMSPHDPQNSIFNVGIAISHYLEGRYAGQLDEARAALDRVKETHPDLSIAWIERNVPYTSVPMVKFVEGMRKAGLE
ncbi:tetratricopeptide repeat protein [Bradyrhizobium sp.]|uniref:tetratricopeptide repeat protein n=1 Tax=Bradyrhizobium sp. TaxID=376 RepID=UPI003BB068FC